MHWLTTTLLCALALAASDAVAKKTLGQVDVRSLTLIRLGLTGLIMLPLALSQPLPSLQLEFWLWMLLLVPAEIIAMALYMKSIRDHPLSLTVPYLSFTPAFVILTAWLLLGETITLSGGVGIVLIICGAWLLNLPETGPETGPVSLRRVFEPLKAIFRNPGSRLMLLAAVIYSITASGSKVAMTGVTPAMSPGQFGSLYFALVGITAIFVFGRNGMGVIKRNFVPSLIVALLMAVMVYLHFLALAQVEVAYMVSVKRTSLLFGILFGVLFFQEKHLGLHLLAASLMLAGVFVIGLL